MLLEGVERRCGRGWNRNCGKRMLVHEGRYCFGAWSGMSSEVRSVDLLHPDRGYGLALEVGREFPFQTGDAE